MILRVVLSVVLSIARYSSAASSAGQYLRVGGYFRVQYLSGVRVQAEAVSCQSVLD